jgi:hypothetical protein
MVFRRVIECRHPFAVSSWPCSRASLNLRLIREVDAQFLSCLTNEASAPSPNLSPRHVADHGSTHCGERD